MVKQKNKDRQIKTIEKLKKLAANGLECFILLNGGLRSSKYISYDPDRKTFYVLHYIDGSDETLTESQILDSVRTNIGEAMEKGALILD